MKSAKIKPQQVQAIRADILCTACENGHSQLTDVNEHYGLEVKGEFLSNLVADALVQKEAIESADEPIPLRTSVNW